MEVTSLEQRASWFRPVTDLPSTRFYLRCLWIVVRLVAAYWFSNQVSPFFYQQF